MNPKSRKHYLTHPGFGDRLLIPACGVPVGRVSQLFLPCLLQPNCCILDTARAQLLANLVHCLHQSLAFVVSLVIKQTALRQVSLNQLRGINDFDPYLMVVDMKGNVVAKGKAERQGSIKVSLPKDGSYRLIVSTVKPGDRGQFFLSIHAIQAPTKPNQISQNQ